MGKLNLEIDVVGAAGGASEFDYSPATPCGNLKFDFTF